MNDAIHTYPVTSDPERALAILQGGCGVGVTSEMDAEAVQGRVEALLLAREPRVTYNASKPGRRFVPDGNGGGTLHITTRVERKGFRPKVITITKRVVPYSEVIAKAA